MRRLLSQRARARPGYGWLAWIVVGLWLAFCLATLDYNGPFLDEGIYVTAGQRTLEGHGLTDGFLGWFAGSLLWPVFAGLGSKIGGLAGARAVALVMAAMGFAALVLASRNLFGERVAFWTAGAFALSGPFLALARMAVYDAAALAGIAVSFWAITELARRDHRAWLILSAAAFCWAIFAKYPTGLMLLPLMGVLLVLRKGKAITDLFLFGFVSAAISLAFFLPVRERIVSFFSYRLVNSPAMGITPEMIAVDILSLSIVPLLLAAGGWLAAGRGVSAGREMPAGGRDLATVLLLSLVVWPVYHLVLQDGVSREKHLVYGFLFAYPLVGLALGALWQAGQRRTLGAQAAVHTWAALAYRGLAVSLVLGLVVVGAVQLVRFNNAWPDARPAIHHLLTGVDPGQKLLINESWPYTMYLYEAGRIESPWDVYDVYRITHGQSEIDLCEYDWFVDAQGANQWPGYVAFQVHRCGGFEPVLTTTSMVVAIGSDLGYIRYPVKVVVWQNVGR